MFKILLINFLIQCIHINADIADFHCYNGLILCVLWFSELFENLNYIEIHVDMLLTHITEMQEEILQLKNKWQMQYNKVHEARNGKISKKVCD